MDSKYGGTRAIATKGNEITRSQVTRRDKFYTDKKAMGKEWKDEGKDHAQCIQCEKASGAKLVKPMFPVAELNKIVGYVVAGGKHEHTIPGFNPFKVEQHNEEVDEESEEDDIAITSVVPGTGKFQIKKEQLDKLILSPEEQAKKQHEAREEKLRAKKKKEESKKEPEKKPKEKQKEKGGKHK